MLVHDHRGQELDGGRGKHGAGTAAEREDEIEPGIGFSNLKAHPRDMFSPARLYLQNSQTAPSTGDTFQTPKPLGDISHSNHHIILPFLIFGISWH